MKPSPESFCRGTTEMRSRFLRVNPSCNACGEPSERVRLKPNQTDWAWHHLVALCVSCANEADDRRDVKAMRPSDDQ
jgi:hypothetical protein